MMTTSTIARHAHVCAFRFDVEVPAHLTDGEVTNLIDADFDEHCDTAKQRGRSFACTERRAATA
ncbi:MAG: hypothetical protein L6Q68_15840 [Aquabacterium sp.]|nr:hypothetical protein [Aquabacterium sp.]